VKSKITSHTSTTNGNAVTVSQLTQARAGKQITSKRQETSTLSDDDDSVERATIMMSPPKGRMRLSSAVS
jgi:hypothetical protein